MDKFYEQMTPAYKSGLYNVLGFLVIAMVVIAALTITLFLPMGIAAAGLAVLFFFLKRKQYVEYEYIFTSGDIDIDVIMEAKKRKRVINFDIKEVQMLAPQGSYHLDGASKGKKIMAYNKNTKDQIYVAVVSSGGSVNEVYFTPDEQFVSLCFRVNPGNVKKS